jgi:hypothetical protein
LESHKRFYGPAWIRLVLVTNIIVLEFCRSCMVGSFFDEDRQTGRMAGRRMDGRTDGQTNRNTTDQQLYRA